MTSIRSSIVCAIAGLASLALFASISRAADAPAGKEVWEGRFSQCSYNAVSSALAYFYGPTGAVDDRKDFEHRTFVAPLESAGYEPYYGWGPWTSYMVKSGKMVWNGHAVQGLDAERFSLRTAAQPELKGRLIIVHYAPGERSALRDKLLAELKRGPVVMWTPYAGALDAQFARPWHHVSRLDDNTDAVPFGPFTHSVTLFLRPGAREDALVGVTDCSVRRGIYETDPDTIVSTSSAMTTFVRLKAPGEKSMLERGFGGIKDDQYNVVFFKSTSAPETRPATAPSASSDAGAADAPADVLAAVPADERALFIAALGRSGARREQWLEAMRQAPEAGRADLAFLIANMPTRDLVGPDKDLVLEDVALAEQARVDRPWGHAIPESVFRDALLPYVSLNERRERWRPDFMHRFSPVVADCKTATQAALALNAAIFKQVGVQYHPTKRPKPDQSPSESMAAGYASCSGLSILLVDACRSVGVPARLVGTPMWTVPKGDANGNHAGNHSWVEIWDGQWHVIGASEVTPIDQTWFLGNASKALEGTTRDDGIDHHIYAASWRQTGTPFRLVWDESIDYVPAEDVTADYADRTPVKIVLKGGADAASAHLTLRRAGLLIADLDLGGSTTLILSAGQRYDAELRSAGRERTQSFVAPSGSGATVALSLDGDPRH